MVRILREDEGEPTTPPPAILTHRDEAGERLDEDPLVAQAIAWRRIEDWISWRWAARPVEIIVEGPGDWEPRLRPFAVSSVERFTSAGWVAETPTETALGLLLDHAIYRVTGTAGDDSTPPEAVQEAHRRLSEYGQGIASAWHAEGAAYRDGEVQMSAGWAAKGLHLSGAADLLRPWRGIGR